MHSTFLQWSRTEFSIRFKRYLNPAKQYSDDYITWLRYCNAGMMNSGNIYCFDYVIKNLKSDSPILEIGSFCGLSANMILYFLQKHKKNNQLYCCDLWDYDLKKNKDQIGQSGLKYVDFNESILNSFQQNIRQFNPQADPAVFRMDSGAFLKKWKSGNTVLDIHNRSHVLNGPISFAYIDGDHSYEGAKKDFMGIDLILEPGGFVFFDDSEDESNWEVKKVIREVKQMDTYELVMSNPNYLFRKK